MIIVLYVIAAAIMLLSGLCLIGLTQSLHISKPEPVFTTTEPTVTEEAFIMKQNEPTVIHIKKENEDKLLSWESSDESIVEVDSGGRLDAYTTGVAEITARYKDGSETVYTVTVEEAEKKPERNIFSTAITANEDILERNELGNQDLYHILVNREQNIVTVYTYDDDGEYTVPVRAMVCSCGLLRTRQGHDHGRVRNLLQDGVARAVRRRIRKVRHGHRRQLSFPQRTLHRAAQKRQPRE